MSEIDFGLPLELPKGMEIMSNAIMERSLVKADEESKRKKLSIPNICEMYDILCSIILTGDNLIVKQAEEIGISTDDLERIYGNLVREIRKGLFWTRELLIPYKNLDNPGIKEALSWIPESDDKLRELRENKLSILVNDYSFSRDEDGNLEVSIRDLREIEWPDNITIAGRTNLSKELGINEYVRISPCGNYTYSPIKSISFHTKTGNIVLSSGFSPLYSSPETGVIFKKI